MRPDAPGALVLSYLPIGISSFAADIDGVMTFIYWVVGIWFVIAELVLFGLVISGRRQQGRRAAWLPADTLGTNAAVLGPVVLVFLCDMAIEAKADPVWHEVKIDLPEKPDVHVRVMGRQFMWLFSYPGKDGLLGTIDDVQTTELHVPRDAVVRFELGSEDVLHSFHVRELRLKQDAVPGRMISGWFDANTVGTYEIGCSEICGKGHTAMKANLVVEERASFDAWLSAQP